MNIARTAIALVLAMSVSGPLLADDSGDAALEQAVVRAHGFRHPGEKGRVFEDILRQCGSDSNRFCRLLSVVAATNAAVRMDAIIWIGRCGSAADMEGLLGLVEDGNCGRWAVDAIGKVGGVTSNLINAVETFCARADVQSAYDKTCARMSVVKAAYRAGATDAEKRLAAPVIQEYARTETANPRPFDEYLLQCDPAYRWSARRLSALRAVLAAGANPEQTNYVAAAIGELEAYPESELPE